MSPTPTTKPYPVSTLMELRRLMPRRPLSFDEALQRAEIQAARLLALLDVTDGPVPDNVITGQPRLIVRRAALTGSSGESYWQRGAWRIDLSASEPDVRRRFTLAHEYKHILDAPLEAELYTRLRSTGDHHPLVEQVCDYFAACLLMPKRLIKRAWFSGLRDPAQLADLFAVSAQAMTIRLRTLGLLETPTRCAAPLGRSLPLRRSAPMRRYERALSINYAGAC